jgi:hypothetical protein
LTKIACRIATTAGNQALARVPGRSFELEWQPNKQLPNVLLEGASRTWTRLFFTCCATRSQRLPLKPRPLQIDASRSTPHAARDAIEAR